LTVKTGRVQGSREEFEYDIPVMDAERLIALCGEDILEKVRYYVEYAAVVWEVDEYAGLLSGVVLAAVEFQSRDQLLDLLPWIGREVTEDASHDGECRDLLEHGRSHGANMIRDDYDVQLRHTPCMFPAPGHEPGGTCGKDTP